MHKPVRQLDSIKYYGCSIILGNLSNYDGDANENVTQKTNFTFLKLLRYYPNYFNL